MEEAMTIGLAERRVRGWGAWAKAGCAMAVVAAAAVRRTDRRVGLWGMGGILVRTGRSGSSV